MTDKSYGLVFVVGFFFFLLSENIHQKFNTCHKSKINLNILIEVLRLSDHKTGKIIDEDI